MTEPSKTNKIGAESKPFEYPGNIRKFAEQVEISSRLLLEQIEKCNFVDIEGHKLTKNIRYIELKRLLTI